MLESVDHIEAPRSTYVTSLHANILVNQNLKLDTEIAQLQERYAHNEEREAVDQIIDRARIFYTEFLDSLQGDQVMTWNDYFRLLSHITFLEQRVKVPVVFGEQKYWRERQELVNGVYGMNATMIEQALYLHDHPSSDDRDKIELRGVIQEQTVAALLNYDQSPSAIALPARTTDDLHHETAIDFWHIESKKLQLTGIQVKAVTPLRFRTATSSGSLIVTAKDFQNTYASDGPSLQTSRMIVAHVRGALPEAEQTALLTLKNNFQEMIRHKL